MSSYKELRILAFDCCFSAGLGFPGAVRINWQYWQDWVIVLTAPQIYKRFCLVLRRQQNSLCRQNGLKYWKHLKIALQFSMCNCVSLGLGKRALLGIISEVAARV